MLLKHSLKCERKIYISAVGLSLVFEHKANVQCHVYTTTCCKRLQGICTVLI